MLQVEAVPGLTRYDMPVCGRGLREEQREGGRDQRRGGKKSTGGREGGKGSEGG